MKILSRGGQGLIHQYGTGNSRLIIKTPNLKEQNPENVLYEADMLTRAQGKGVVNLVGVDRGSYPKIALEYIPGRTFLEQINAIHDNNRNLEAVVKGLKKLAISLGHIHSREIIHGDVKPDNVFNRRREATWIDFGYSFKMNECGVYSCDSEKELSGTEGYMHPWISEDGMYSEQTDVWALMCTTLYAITGKYSELDSENDIEKWSSAGILPKKFSSQKWKDFLKYGFDRETGGYVDVSDFLEEFPD